LGLPQALRDFIAEWSKNYGIAATFQAIGLGGERLRRDHEIHFYRIAQEALNNVHKHAQAKNVDVTLQRREGLIVLTVEDDGIGLEPTTGDARGMGLINLRERAALMHGLVEFERPASGGTSIIVRAPVASPISHTES
jgi:signal transduction histidine kinase